MGAGRQETPLSRSKSGHSGLPRGRQHRSRRTLASPVHGREIEGAQFYFWGPIAYAIIYAIGFPVARSICLKVAMLGILWTGLFAGKPQRHLRTGAISANQRKIQMGTDAGCLK